LKQSETPLTRIAGLISALVATAVVYGHAQATSGPAKAERALVEQYCAGCHNERNNSGGFSFSQLDLAHPALNADQAEKVILKVRTGLMPPAGRPRPSAAALQAFASALEARVDAEAKLDPGRPLLHRLNRAEYRNAVRDLLDLDVDVENLLPPDNITQGFDNMSEALTVTPTLMDAYVTAAGKVSRLAVGDPDASPTVDLYRLPTNFSQSRHVEGTPLGTRGGMAVLYNFPADADYVFKASLVFTRNTFLFGSTIAGEQLEIAVDGERIALFDINPLMKGVDNNLETPPVKVKAGPRTISAAFVAKSDGPIDDFLRRPERALGDDFVGQTPGLTGLPHLREFGVVGPYNVTGTGDTPSRRSIFICRPNFAKAAADSPGNQDQERSCARKILSALAFKAFRGPVTESSLSELLGAYEDGHARGGFEAGIRLALQLLLVHPEFVFRFERAPSGVTPSSDFQLDDIALASRLSFFLWSSTPDDELLTLARRSKLRDPQVLRQQVRRMLADVRSQALASNFAAQWLHLRALASVNPDVYLYPDSDDNLFQSMKRETELLFDSIVRENRDVVDLLRADYTFVDERLATHYGIPNIVGTRFRRVTLTDPARFGLLGQGSILSLTSPPSRTSPVARGKWVLEQILGVAPPPPPPVVPQLEENNVIGGETLKLRSVRERLEEHRTVEPCRSCHQIMDPIGLALENFDAIGAWRRNDSGHPVDAAGQLTDGTPIDGPVALRNALIKYSGAYVTNLTARLLAYGVGRVTSSRDMPFVRQIVKEAGSDRRFESIVFGIVTSAPFQKARVDASAESAAR
jgi:mono/diheme cytochrome c family protein